MSIIQFRILRVIVTGAWSDGRLEVWSTKKCSILLTILLDTKHTSTSNTHLLHFLYAKLPLKLLCSAERLLTTSSFWSLHYWITAFPLLFSPGSIGLYDNLPLSATKSCTFDPNRVFRSPTITYCRSLSIVFACKLATLEWEEYNRMGQCRCRKNESQVMTWGQTIPALRLSCLWSIVHLQDSSWLVNQHPLC